MTVVVITSAFDRTLADDLRDGEIVVGEEAVDRRGKAFGANDIMRAGVFLGISVPRSELREILPGRIRCVWTSLCCSCQRRPARIFAWVPGFGSMRRI